MQTVRSKDRAHGKKSWQNRDPTAARVSSVRSDADYAFLSTAHEAGNELD